MSARIIIGAIFIILLIGIHFFFGFKLLSRYNQIIQLLIVLLAIFEAGIALEWFKPKPAKDYLVMVAVGLFILGVFLIFINQRLEDLQPIAYATAHVELNIQPTKIDDSKMNSESLSDMSLVKNSTVSHPFMQRKNSTAWGREGLINTLHLDYTMDWFSVGYGEPFDFIDKYDAIELAVFMLYKDTKIISGRCIVTFNGFVRREIEIPPQKVSEFYHIFFNIKK